MAGASCPQVTKVLPGPLSCGPLRGALRAHRHERQLGPVSHVKLLEENPDRVLHGLLPDTHPPGDLAVRQASPDQAEKLALAPGDLDAHLHVQCRTGQKRFTPAGHLRLESSAAQSRRHTTYGTDGDLGRNGTGLTRDAFDHLLGALDPHRETAGEKYEQLRRILIGFFRARGTPHPDECADQTLTVAGSRLAGGEKVQNISAYCLGVARLVAFERFRQRVTEDAATRQIPAPVPVSEQVERDDERQERLERCLELLDDEERRVILAYYGGEDGTRVQTRKRLADELNIPMNALRIRAHRIRKTLERAFLDARQPGR